jgi:hypothetical protein
VVARPGPGGEKRRGGRAPYHEEFEAIRPFLLPWAATGGIGMKLSVDSLHQSDGGVLFCQTLSEYLGCSVSFS